MSAATTRSWRRRLASWLVRPLGLSIGEGRPAVDPSRKQEKLARALVHEREKVGKVKQRLELVQAELELARTGRDQADRKREAYRAEAWATAKELALLRRHVAAKPIEAPIVPSARARALTRERAAAFDSIPPDAEAIRQGVLFPARPAPRTTARPPSPLRIATVGEWRSPLADTAHLGVLAREMGDPLVQDADVLVFPRCEDMDFAEKAALVPEGLWRRAREGHASVVLDSSNEAFRFWRGHAQAMHDFLASRGVDPAHAVHLTQDRLYREDYEPWCAAEKLAPMRIVVFDAFIGRTLQAFRDNGQQVFEARLAAFAERSAHRSRRFLSLNFAARPTKVLFLTRLLRDGLFDRGWISFGGFANGGEDAKLGKARILDRLGALHGFGEEAADLAPYADQLEAMGSVLFGVDGNGAPRKQVLLADDLAEYQDSWFTVVTETEMHPRPHRITEKPFKPLLNFHPFLVLGNPGSLAALRGYGFETFSDIFDETYDEELHPRRRFDMVYDQLVRLCAMDEAEMARLTGQVTEVLAYNACWGLTELPRRFAETLTGQVITQLAPPARRA